MVYDGVLFFSRNGMIHDDNHCRSRFLQPTWELNFV